LELRITTCGNFYISWIINVILCILFFQQNRRIIGLGLLILSRSNHFWYYRWQ